jgi:hypothetical protein
MMVMTMKLMMTTILMIMILTMIMMTMMKANVIKYACFGSGTPPILPPPPEKTCFP